MAATGAVPFLDPSFSLRTTPIKIFLTYVSKIAFLQSYIRKLTRSDKRCITMTAPHFRRALGEFATGVAIITARGREGELIGMTMSSFNSVSLDPPLVLFSVDRKARSLEAMVQAAGLAVNVLARDQEGLSNQFARALSNKWSDVQTSVGHAEAPLIAGALAHFECAPYARYDGGDHVIFVAQVLRHTVQPGSAAPLIFFRGRYRDLRDESEREPEWPLPIHY